MVNQFPSNKTVVELKPSYDISKHSFFDSVKRSIHNGTRESLLAKMSSKSLTQTIVDSREKPSQNRNPLKSKQRKIGKRIKKNKRYTNTEEHFYEVEAVEDNHYDEEQSTDDYDLEDDFIKNEPSESEPEELDLVVKNKGHKKKRLISRERKIQKELSEEDGLIYSQTKVINKKRKVIIDEEEDQDQEYEDQEQDQEQEQDQDQDQEEEKEEEVIIPNIRGSTLVTVMSKQDELVTIYQQKQSYIVVESKSGIHRLHKNIMIETDETLLDILDGYNTYCMLPKDHKLRQNVLISFR